MRLRKRARTSRRYALCSEIAILGRWRLGYIQGERCSSEPGTLRSILKQYSCMSLPEILLFCFLPQKGTAHRHVWRHSSAYWSHLDQESNRTPSLMLFLVEEWDLKHLNYLMQAKCDSNRFEKLYHVVNAIAHIQ